MKRIILALILLVMLATLMGNPLPSIYVSKFWFDANNVLQLKFSSHVPYLGVSNLDLFDGTNHIIREIDFTVPANLVQSYPEAAVTPIQGSFVLSYGPTIYEQESVSWGPALTNDISSLTTEECGMQVYESDGFENTYTVWVKELKIYPESEFWPMTSSTLDVACYDFSGAPVADIPVWLNYFYYPWDYTDDDGHCNQSVSSTKLHLQVNFPATQVVYCDTIFFAEPNQTYAVNVWFHNVENSDPTALMAPARLIVAPSVVRLSQGSSVKLDYAGKLSSQTNAEIYDLKGRLVAKTAYTASGMAWQLPVLASGVYFINLNSGGQSLSKAKLIILK